MELLLLQALIMGRLSYGIEKPDIALLLFKEHKAPITAIKLIPKKGNAIISLRLDERSDHSTWRNKKNSDF